MTEADGGGPDPTTDESTDDDVILKDESSDADEPNVFDGIGGKPRLTWSSVTDGGSTPRPAPGRDDAGDRSSFQFDLGGALARLGGDEPTSSDTGEPESAPAPMARREPPPAAPEPSPAESPPEQRAAPSEPRPSPLENRPTSSPEQPDADRPLIDLGRLDFQTDTSSIPSPTEPVNRGGSVAPAEPPATPPVEPDYPRRVPGAHLDPRHRFDDAGQQPVEARDDGSVPSIREATPVDEAPRRSTSRPSVFGDTGSGGGTTAGDGIAGAPHLPGVPASMPTLPASNPAAPPPVAEPIADAAAAPDITALRSAQLKAKRQQRQGKLFGRSLLAFVVVGGLIAAAMVFGRSLLFDTDWDGRLTPVVNEVEADRGASFESTVPLTTVGAAEFGDRVLAATIGTVWLDRVPEWRALNLAVGEVTADSVADELARERQAFYDATNDEIVLVEGADNARVDLRVALEAAFDAQQGAPAPTAELADSGFVGVSPLPVIAEEAVDRYLANRAAERPIVNESLPIPVAYQLVATRSLGEPVLIGAGVDPASQTYSSPGIDSLGAVLDDDPANTASGLLRPGDRSLSDSVALGTDDWSLVWATRLPESTVIRLVDEVVADSYRTVDRGGTTCAIGVFETATEADGGTVFSSMLIWAAAAPPVSQAVATQIGPTHVQIDACDPGVGGGVAGNPGVVDGLIDRQQRRLTN